VSAVNTGFLLAVLTFAASLAVAAAILGEHVFDWIEVMEVLASFAVPWLVWGVVFYRISRDAQDAATRAVSWLMRGSVLELLIAVPSHVIVRRRDDCSAPIATGFGLVTGISIMLLSFGPSVFFLYQKRMAARRVAGRA
jgi:hypothetical protein